MMSLKNEIIMVVLTFLTGYEVLRYTYCFYSLIDLLFSLDLVENILGLNILRTPWPLGILNNSAKQTVVLIL